MKKVLALPLLAMAAFVSQAWGESCKVDGKITGCQYGTGCFELTTEYSSAPGCDAGECTCDVLLEACGKDGAVYTFGSRPSIWASKPYGEGEKCGSNGGTAAAGSNEACGYYCKWDTGCYEIKTDIRGDNGSVVLTCTDAIANCDKDATRYDNSSCSGTAIGGTDCGNVYCKWETGCVKILPDAESGTTTCQEAIDNCKQYGEYFTSPGCSGSSPIIKSAHSVALVVAPYGRSLHISSIREATVSLYDMSGVKVYSGKVRAGNSVFGLEKVASGSYYAVVQAGSESKKIPVILK